MPISPEALTTLAQAKQNLGITGTDEDALLESYIEAASAACETFCRRRFARAQGVTEIFHVGASDSPILLLRRPPVESLILSRDGVTLVADEDYRLKPATGIVELLSPMAGVYVATYTGGYVTEAQAGASGGTLTRNLPRDVELACILAVTTLYRGANRDPNVTRENLLSAGQAFSNGWFVLSPAAQALLHPWRLEP